MTNEEAIVYLERADTTVYKKIKTKTAEALEMAIKALEQQLRDCKTCKHSDNGNCAGSEECHECMWESKYEQQPSEPRTNLAETSQDCISRTELIQKLNAWDSKAHGIPNYAWKVIREMPSVTPQRPKGKWIHWTDDYKDYCTCSECGYGEEGEVLLKDKTPYCPYCGSYNGGNDNGDE